MTQKYSDIHKQKLITHGIILPLERLWYGNLFFFCSKLFIVTSKSFAQGKDLIPYDSIVFE